MFSPLHVLARPTSVWSAVRPLSGAASQPHHALPILECTTDGRKLKVNINPFPLHTTPRERERCVSLSCQLQPLT